MKFNSERITWDKLKIPEYQKLASKALSEASKFWNTPDCIPHLCSLYPNLLVTCAKIVFSNKLKHDQDQTRTNKAGKRTAFHPAGRIAKAESELKRAHINWKKAGKPQDKDNSSCKRYRRARSSFQFIRRYEENLKNIKHNNELM